MRAVDPPRPEEIARARARIQDVVLRTPLVPLDLPDAPARIHLKLECLQPIGSFKLRGATNAMRSARLAVSNVATTSSAPVALVTRSASSPMVVTGTASSSAAATHNRTYRLRSNGARPDRGRRAGRLGSVVARTLASRA